MTVTVLTRSLLLSGISRHSSPRNRLRCNASSELKQEEESVSKRKRKRRRIERVKERVKKRGKERERESERVE